MSRAERFKEILCVAVLIVFMALLIRGSAVSSKTAAEVCDKMIADTSFDEKCGISLCDSQTFKKQFGFSQSDFDGVVYYASDSVMEVREVLLVKLKDKSQAQELTEALEKRIDEKARLFKGYAPEQSAQIEKYVLENRGGFILFAVYDEPDKLIASFKKAL